MKQSERYVRSIIAELEDGPNDWRSACGDPEYLAGLLHDAYMAGAAEQSRLAERHAAEVNRRRGEMAVAREALDELGVAKKQNGITLTFRQRIQLLGAMVRQAEKDLEREIELYEAAVGIAEHQQKRADDLARHFEDFVEFAATCRRENTYEWMVLMLDHLNGAAGRLDPDSWFRLVGADHFEVMHTPKEGGDV